MRHGKSFRKLSRLSAHRRAMMRNMVTSLLEHEQIRTTDAKAKELRKVAEHMITLGKDGSLHARRQALAYVRSKRTVAKLFSELAPRYADRSGGYLQINKLGPRIGDGAPISVVTLISEEAKKPRRRRRRRSKPTQAEAKPQAAAAPSPAPEKEVKKAAPAPEEQAPEKQAQPADEAAAKEAEPEAAPPAEEPQAEAAEPEAEEPKSAEPEAAVPEAEEPEAVAAEEKKQD